MTKKICFLLFVLLSMQGFAQTGIGTSTPHASAKLDVTSTNKGFLPPRVTLTAATDAVTIPSPAEGLLVYNVGSVGLQAGYYYWNGVSWATIATGTTAGNAVVASDLVKLYGEAWSSATGKIGNTNGYSFTVPVSGRYLFDFSSVTYGSTNFNITFYVRQGTTTVGSDAQVSTNNGVRVEYNGKVEVNLQSGTTYNVYVTSSNVNRGLEDYDRVYYKMVAGNLPVNQHVADRNIQLNNNFLSNDGDNEGIRIDNSGNVGIGTTTPTEKLEVSGNVKATDFIGTASSAKLFLLEAYSNAIYSMPGSYSIDICRYNTVNNTINVPNSWFNTTTYRFTPQKVGYWEIRASYDIFRNGETYLMINKNNVNLGQVGSLSEVQLIVSKILYLNGSTDFITIANSGFNASATRGQGIATSWFQARWVGE